LFFAFAASALAQTPGVAAKPYMGWSTFSQQTISSTFLTQANIAAQSDALLSSGLQAHGYNYINIDSGWMGAFDANGRPIPIQLGDIAPGAQGSVKIQIDFSKCSQNALFTASVVFSSNQGADAGDITEQSTAR
jgi:hypothetical protein